MDQQPLVSCVMPTYNRRKFIPHAIRYFMRQEHPNKELIIVDDGSDSIEDLIPNNENIKYIRLKKKVTLGEKLNIACNKAEGSIIANWDDDDWYAPRRLKYQVAELAKHQTQVCGINNLLYFDLGCKQAFEYIYPADHRKWLLGSSLCYYRSHWQANPFEKINVGMDGLFVWRTSSSQVTVLPDPTMSVHMIHNQNVCPKRTTGDWWHPYPVKDIEKIMQRDFDYYYEDRQPRALVTDRTPVKAPAKQLKNIYACLVHEKLDCVVDMVRNLHYHDPSSIIILFNGGTNFKLNESSFDFKKYGAIIHPNSFPVKHGYLHGFALESMRFALQNFSFDIFTIVDSDQLSMQPGYSGFISEFLAGKSNIGLLSNRPERLTAKNTEVWTSIQPFKEYNLWKPFLKKFPKGEEKFVHWTFWPSTVFTHDAAKDMLKLFDTNTQLQHIMQRTKIWATEEIIFPTLVSLLGYNIEKNPCCHDFVNYQKSYSTQDIDCALNDPYAFWVHPVSRNYDDVLRKHARKHLNNYIPQTQDAVNHASNKSLFLQTEAINSIKKIEGWLTDREAELLIACALKACCKFPDSQVVEVGCYHGKATVLLGSVARSASDKIKVYAIDEHNGILGSADQGLYTFKPSLDSFKKNIGEAGLSETIISVVSKSTDVKWSQPISLLLIDGLHDYLSISNDFNHFNSFVKKGGYLAFHDYADYFPDVKAFADELILENSYQKIHLSDSLVVLQKQ
ncbi:glycosyltransferase [Pedobacter sp. HMF7647]|uniref:Glycosyltransferase n=1 Tax=Hufsiella arboris TaxID=2695275 RepID=A0A7K1Y502_9SPHI|nr:glycosyltransferase [Hufsiella arboris]MXV49662.1 glycosyltransferase [Hufsiella arboris]